MFIKTSDLSVIQLDHTNRCNLKCPQCARTTLYAQYPNFKPRDLSINDYKIILSPFSKNISLFHCGNFGDAIASPTFDETFDYSLQKVNKVRVSTNASLRNAQWWKDFAKRGKDQLEVIFSIDGLETTNHLYRLNASWEKIMLNAKAFINAGGYAEWTYIVFDHNKHQVDDAKEIARKIGFSHFNIKFSQRSSLEENKVEETTSTKSTPKNFLDYVYSACIKCKSILNKRLFIDMDMKLWPCCWLGADPHLPRLSQNDIFYLNELYGENFNDLRIYGWELLNHKFFKEYLTKSWEKPSEKYKRLYTCGKTCGDSFEFSSAYGNNFHSYKL